MERRFERWLEADAMHRRAYEQIERIWDELGSVAGTSVAEARKLGKAPFLMRRATRVALGSVALAGVAIVMIIGVNDRFGATGVVSTAAATTYETRIGEIRTIELGGGTRLTLDTATKVARRSGGRPHAFELVRGRARFEFPVAAGRFEVVVPGGRITGQAATFDVSLGSGRPRVSTLHGQVRLRDSVPGTETGHDLKQGRTSEIGIGGASRAMADGSTRWVDGMLGFDGESVGEAVAIFNRFNRRQVRLRDVDPGSMQVTGAFAADRPLAFAEAIAATFGLAISRDGDDIVLSRHH